MSNTANWRNRSSLLLEQREVVLLGVVLDEPLHACRRRADRRRGAPCRGHDVPAERVGELVRRDLAAGTACRRGSPTAAARRAAACRPPASRRRRRTRATSSVAFDDHGMRPSDLELAVAPRTSASVGVGSVPAGAPVPGRVHRAVAELAQRPARGDRVRAVRRHRPHLRRGSRRSGRRSPRSSSRRPRVSRRSSSSSSSSSDVARAAR